MPNAATRLAGLARPSAWLAEHHPPGRSTVTRYVVTVFAFGLVAVLCATIVGEVDVWNFTAIALFGLSAASVWVPLRFHTKAGDRGFTLDEAVLVAMWFTLPAGTPPLLHASATLLGHTALGSPPDKAAFNAGQLAVSATLSTVAFHAIWDGSEVLSASSLIAVVVGTLVSNVANTAALSELFRRLDGRSWRTTVAELGHLYLVTWIGNTSFGLVLAVVALAEPRAIVLAGSLMIGLFFGYRGYAGVLEERQRATRLHAVTRSLADATGSSDAMSAFLEGLAALFGAESAELLLTDRGRNRLEYRAGVTTELPDRPSLVDLAIERGRELAVGDGVETPYRDGLAAPVVYEGRTVGGLAVYDRAGLEPWDETDATLLGAIANEAAVALKNVELFAAVERERALLAEESRKLSDIVENASDGIAMIEADGRIAVWNEAMEAITGVRTAHAFGQPWDIVLRLRDRDGEELIGDNGHVFSRALRGERGDEELDLQCLRRDGEWRWLRCSINPIERSGMGVVGAVLVARDVTRDREVDELKGDFIATVSHELRTPLTPLRGFLDTLSENGHKLSDEQRSDMHRAMRGQVERLERLVGDLLLVADVERRELGLRLEPVDLPELVAASLERLAPASEAGRITVDAPERIGAVGDRAAVIRIVTSLIDNALKHTEGAVQVRVLRDGEQAVCEVADDGPGIAPWDHARVFHRFGRLGNHLHRTQGPGLGLPISRALAQELGGDVTLASDLGRGAMLRLTLPACALHETDGDIARSPHHRA